MEVVYDLKRWQIYEWESATRYYRVEVKQTLFGDWCVVCSWGGRANRLGNNKTLYVENPGAAEKIVTMIAKRRERRGYIPLRGQVLQEGKGEK